MRCFTERGAHEIFFVGWKEEKKGRGSFILKKKIGITVASYLEKFGKELLKFFPFPYVFTTIVYDVDLDFSNIGRGIQSVVPLVNCIACIPGQSGDTVGF